MRAAELVASGIDCAEVNQKLFESKSLEQLRAQAAGISNLHLFENGQIAVITFPYALKAALDLSDEHLETLVDVARSLTGVKVAIAIRQPGTGGTFRVSTRSNCNYDVAALCAKFDGGGHKKAAGCTILAADADEAMNKIVREIVF
jgi:phosphoesterase RecJ-like protein